MNDKTASPGHRPGVPPRRSRWSRMYVTEQWGIRLSDGGVLDYDDEEQASKMSARYGGILVHRFVTTTPWKRFVRRVTIR